MIISEMSLPPFCSSLNFNYATLMHPVIAHQKKKKEEEVMLFVQAQKI